MGASCFLKAYSSVTTGAEQPACSALWSLITEVNITLAPGSASSPAQHPQPHRALPTHHRCFSRKQPQQRKGFRSQTAKHGQVCVLPCDAPPPCNFPSTACSFLLHRGEGERAHLQWSLWEASLQSHPEQGLAYQELQRHSLCTRDGIATATSPHRNQVYLFNLKEKKRFSCNNSQTELLVDY